VLGGIASRMAKEVGGEIKAIAIGTPEDFAQMN
jgi:hypothetical protein